jgi:hypothetical protein
MHECRVIRAGVWFTDSSFVDCRLGFRMPGVEHERKMQLLSIRYGV